MVSFDSFFEKYVEVAKTSSPETLNLNLVPSKPAGFDREEAMLNSQLPQQWHNNLLRLVASYVKEGKSDHQIHAITDELTCNGFTIYETRSDVQIMIEGARKKFLKFKPPEPERASEAPFFQKLSDIELKPIEYLIEDLIPKKALVEMFGQSGCGKSFLGVDIACSIATGKTYHDLKTEKGAVVYLAGEGHRGITQRGWAWFKYHGLSVDEAPLFISKHGIGLSDAHQLEFIKMELDDLKVKGNKPSLIIIDTLARNFGGGDENSTKDMSEFIVAVDELINRYDASVLIVHHSGHSEQSRGRGNSALKAAVDAEYQIKKSDRFIYLNCTKMKDAEEMEEIRFFLDDILIQNSDGNHISTVVPIRRSQQVDRYRMTKKDADDLKKFREAYIELHGEYNTDEPISLTLEEWRPIFYRTHHGDNQEAKRKAFERARKALVEKGILKVSDDTYTFTPKETGRVRDIIKTEMSEGQTDADTPL
jgi:hypothetical protein